MENNTEVLEEKKVETPKKKSPVGLIILIIVLMIGCLVGGYFINEAGLLVGKKDETEKKEEKKDTKKEEKEPVVTTYAVTDEKVRDLINNLVTHEPSRKNLCTAFEAYVLDKKVTVNDISNDTAWDIIMEYSDMEKGQKISLDSVNKAIKKFLGKDYKFDPKSVNTETCVANYIYDETEKTFTYVSKDGGCGGTCGPRTDYKMVKAVDTDGVLKIDVKVIFASLDQGKDGMYSDYARTNKIGTFEDNGQTIARDAMFDKGSNYQFTFKLEDGNYVFVSSEPVK